jgi:hypothetical protein
VSSEQPRLKGNSSSEIVGGTVGGPLGAGTALFERDRYQVFAASYVGVAHQDQNHNPNPFVTSAARPKKVADSLSALKPADFNLIGLAISWSMLPLAYGYFLTSIPTRRLTGDFARDGYEIRHG